MCECSDLVLLAPAVRSRARNAEAWGSVSRRLLAAIRIAEPVTWQSHAKRASAFRRRAEVVA